MRPLWPRIAAAVGVLVGGAVLAGCCCCLPPRTVGEALSRTAVAARPCQPGERCEAGGVSLTVHGVRRLPEINGALPPAGRVFLVVSVTVENSGLERASCSPGYFRVTDSAGASYASAPFTPPPSLGAEELAPGERASGYVAFEVEARAEGLLLRYEPPELVGQDPLRVTLSP